MLIPRCWDVLELVRDRHTFTVLSSSFDIYVTADICFVGIFFLYEIAVQQIKYIFALPKNINALKLYSTYGLFKKRFYLFLGINAVTVAKPLFSLFPLSDRDEIRKL